MARADPRIVGITGAMPAGTGLSGHLCDEHLAAIVADAPTLASYATFACGPTALMQR